MSDSDAELAFASATTLAEKIKNKEISAVELLQLYLDRVDKYNPDLNAIVVDIRDQAMLEAKTMDATVARGDAVGPLHGVPMTVKESYNLAGTPTTWGNPAWRDKVAEEDAESVKKLKNAGANIFGKTNVPLSLADFQSYNEIYGTTNNPYDHSRTPGGSSGGSAAALAAGLTGIETGSDIGGSIRNPAHFCGVFGHKPTYEMLWMRGHAPPGDIRSSSDISVIGPLARSARDLDTAVRVMAGPNEISARGMQLNLPEWRGRSLRDLKVAVWKNDQQAPVAQEVEARVELVCQALQDAGARIDEDARPSFTSENSHDTYQNLLQATMAMRMPDEDYEGLKEYVAKLDPNDSSQGAKVLRAQVSSFKTWGQSNELRHHLRWSWHEFFKQYDVLITPIMATAAFEHDHSAFGDRKLMIDNQQRPYFEQVFWAGLTGVAYLPSTVIPTGLNDAGLPIGVQIVGPEYGDLITIGVAGELENIGFKFTPPPNYLT
ncbi:MAG: amidase [Gammaproteobacteria bacterium]|nr:amidase [Gammaproteobacteria bacterium]